MLTPSSFQEILHAYFRQHKRTFPWRETTNPYHILVSEVMLQQTQADRVIPKYKHFLKEFPTIKTLSQAPLVKVLAVWSGLGYNRRAKFLKRTAQEIVKKHTGKIPANFEKLVTLPGIGPNTAGAILTYAYNQPVVFIETNIRTVFIHHFFKDREEVSDTEIMAVLEKVLDRKSPRKFYTALMDYGTHLKKTYPNPSRQSKHHTKQSKFEGSNRQLRGQVIKLLIKNKKMSERQICTHLKTDKARIQKIIHKLISESLIIKNDTLLITFVLNSFDE